MRAYAHSVLNSAKFSAAADSLHAQTDPNSHPALHERVEQLRSGQERARLLHIRKVLAKLPSKEASLSDALMHELLSLHEVILLLVVDPSPQSGVAVKLAAADVAKFVRVLLHCVARLERKQQLQGSFALSWASKASWHVMLLSHLVEIYRDAQHVQAAREAVLADSAALDTLAAVIAGASDVPEADHDNVYIAVTLATDFVKWLLEGQPKAAEISRRCAEHVHLLSALGGVLVQSALHSWAPTTWVVAARLAALDVLGTLAQCLPGSNRVERVSMHALECFVSARVPHTLALCARSYREPLLVHPDSAEAGSPFPWLEAGIPPAKVRNPLRGLEGNELEAQRVMEILTLADLTTTFLTALQRADDWHTPIAPHVHAAWHELLQPKHVRHFLPVVGRLITPPPGLDDTANMRSSGLRLLGALLFALDRNISVVGQLWPTLDGAQGAPSENDEDGFYFPRDEGFTEDLPRQARNALHLQFEKSMWLLVDCSGEPLVRRLKQCLRNRAVRARVPGAGTFIDTQLQRLIDCCHMVTRDMGRGVDGSILHVRVVRELAAKPAWKMGADAREWMEEDEYDKLRPGDASSLGHAATLCSAPDCLRAAPSSGEPTSEQQGDAAGSGSALESHVPLRLCGRCRRAAYCSRECQERHWKAHKPACKQHVREAAQQEASGAGGAGAPAHTLDATLYRMRMADADSRFRELDGAPAVCRHMLTALMPMMQVDLLEKEGLSEAAAIRRVFAMFRELAARQRAAQLVPTGCSSIIASVSE